MTKVGSSCMADKERDFRRASKKTQGVRKTCLDFGPVNPPPLPPQKEKGGGRKGKVILPVLGRLSSI